MPGPASGDDRPKWSGNADLSRDEGFLPAAPPRASFESVLVRLIATAGVVGIGTAVGAILGSSDVAAWIIGLVVSLLSVIFASVLWRSRRL